MISPQASVAVCIPCRNQAAWLPHALDSVRRQTMRPREVIVVDDGSHDDLAAVVSRYPEVRLLRQDHAGLPAARNTAFAASSADKIIFLDADDSLLPNAVADGLRCFAANREAAYVYGSYRQVTRGGPTISVGPRASDRLTLLRYNSVGMIASVMFERGPLAAVGGFDPELGMCEDWDLYLRLSRTGGRFAAQHEGEVAVYVRHGRNMSNDLQQLRHWIAEVRRKELERGLTTEERAAWEEGAAVWEKLYPDEPSGLLGRARRKLGTVLGRVLSE